MNSVPQNKKVLITGTSRGIGKSLAMQFLKSNACVYGCSRGKSKIDHENYKHFEIDLTNEKKIKQMIKSIKEDCDYLNVLVNNAAISSMNHFMLSPDAINKQIFETNVLSLINCSRESVKLLKNGTSPSIINFSSIAVPWSLDGQLLYAASKSAIETVTKVMCKELNDLGIRVNCIGLPPVRTALTRTVPKDKIDALINRQVIKRQCKLEDIYNAVTFLSSSKSSFITGEIMYLGGIV
jgi:3-oxoacyl-[acyl-carrier protein] reductase